MNARTVFTLALALAGLTLLGCASSGEPTDVRFTRGELRAADDLRVRVRLPSGRSL
jgi:hypothetical protein